MLMLLIPPQVQVQQPCLVHLLGTIASSTLVTVVAVIAPVIMVVVQYTPIHTLPSTLMDKSLFVHIQHLYEGDSESTTTSATTDATDVTDPTDSTGTTCTVITNTSTDTPNLSQPPRMNNNDQTNYNGHSQHFL